jgi:hypothetical protein
LPHQRRNARWLARVLARLAAQFERSVVVDEAIAGVALHELFATLHPGDPIGGSAAAQARELPL